MSFLNESFDYSTLHVDQNSYKSTSNGVPIFTSSQVNQRNQSPIGTFTENTGLASLSDGVGDAFNSGIDSLKGGIDSLTGGIGNATTFPLPTGGGPFNISDIPFGAGSLFGGGSKDQASGTFKVRLVSILEMMQGAPGDIKQVVFEVTPTLSESASVEYSSVQPVHMPGGIQVYKFSASRNYEITAHLISRNTADALSNMMQLQILRSWTRPFFGNSATNFAGSGGINKSAALPDDWHAPLMTRDQEMKAGIKRVKHGDDTGGVNLLGAPPEVLYLYGYSTSSNDSRGGAPGVNINRVPVVLTSLNISFPEDVDYLPVQLSPTANTEPFPVKMDVSMTLVETHSPTEYEKFSLAAFKSGTLKNF